ncbi:MAG: 3'-5' exoribonuclease YhaM family protein [Phycisphaerales bacterium]
MSQSAPPRIFIKQLEPNTRFAGAFAMSNAQLPVTRNGDHYLACLLSDKTGTCPARKWQMSPEDFKRLPADGFVYAEGRTQPFKGELQLIIEHIDPITPTPDQLIDLLPVAPRPIPEMFDELLALLETLQHPAAKALAAEYLADEPMMELFRQAPAAQRLHHAYLGGLLEHTLSLMNLASLICPLYPAINRDLVLLGLFLHDLGKTRELDWSGAFTYTDRGMLIGHIVEGAIMLHDKAQSAMRSAGVRFPPGMITVLQHMILSHHSVPEFGAAKIPSTPEAILVAQLDNLDAKVAMALAAARSEGERAADLGGNFTEKNWALNTRLYRPDPLS